MRATKAAFVDPLWQCLCPSWSQANLTRFPRLVSRPRKTPQCLNTKQQTAAYRGGTGAGSGGDTPIREMPLKSFRPHTDSASSDGGRVGTRETLQNESTSSLYGQLYSHSLYGNVWPCREIAIELVLARREQPNLKIYNALILSNVHYKDGAAWRVRDLLDEMKEAGFMPDNGTGHAILKVVAVHLDHLLRTDTLQYMQQRWFQLSEEGEHDVAAGLLREARFEEALQRLDEMKTKMTVEEWLWDMAVYALCDAGEIEEAYRIMRMRFDTGETKLSRSLWYYMLDKGSTMRHHDATALVWNSQVDPGYLNPSSGICLNVLATAARAGDAVMGTEVFSHLSKRGTAFEPIHYELLISTYLAADPPDLRRALSILTIMPIEKLEPTAEETRGLFMYLRDKPELVKEAFDIVRELHEEERTIPIALLNLLIECHVEQLNFPEAMKIYKLIHTFNPASKGPDKSFANIDTFNLLLKGCRTTKPPDEAQASFLVSELLALRIVPTTLTYDRIILVFLQAGQHLLETAIQAEYGKEAEDEWSKGIEMVNWAFRYFVEMQPLGWMPRFGTVEQLAIQLAKLGDQNAWDVLQVAEDAGDRIEGFHRKGRFIRLNIEQAWEHRTNVLKEAKEAKEAREAEEARKAAEAAAIGECPPEDAFSDQYPIAAGASA